MLGLRTFALKVRGNYLVRPEAWGIFLMFAACGPQNGGEAETAGCNLRL